MLKGGEIESENCQKAEKSSQKIVKRRRNQVRKFSPLGLLGGQTQHLIPTAFDWTNGFMEAITDSLGKGSSRASALRVWLISFSPWG